MAKRHIAFEVKMLREMASALRGGPVSPKALRNALVETFLVHYRNLYDFLFPDYPRRTRLRDDVDAGDYVPDPKQWRNHRPEWLRHYAEHRARMNTQLAHLSYKRLRYDTRSWPDQKMAHRIEAAWLDFIAQLPSERKRWFKSVVEPAAPLAPALPVEATPALTAQATLELTAPPATPDPQMSARKPAPARKRRPRA